MFRNRERRRKGFTLAEVLVVIAIIVVLLGVTFIAASGIIASMKQNKLDTIAQDIYVAAQDRLTEMYTDARSDYLDYDLILQEGNSTDGMFKLAEDNSSVKPSDWDTNIQYAGLNAFYNRAAAAVSAILLPEGSLSPEVEENHWIIEYNATYGYIYGVYYSEKAFSPADITEWYTSGKANAYRVYSGRKGSGVGYYGGMGVLGGKVEMTATSLNLTLNVINAEELKTDLSVKVPTEYKDRAVRVSFTITGETSGNTYSPDPMVMTTLNYGYFNRQQSIIFDSFNKKNNVSQQFKDNLWFTGMYPGENITIKAVAEIGKAGAGQFVADTALDTAECTVTFNSLFESVDLDTNTAYVSAGRHLQNLNNISEDVDIRNVVQISNIDFENKTEDVSDDAIFWWAETYPGRNFEPINNSNIISFVGSSKDEANNTVCHIINGLTIDAADTYAGLFGVLGRTGVTVRVEDVSLVGTQITGTNLVTGALAGRTVGTVELVNTGAYLARDDYNNKTFSTATTALNGKIVGGLIGEVTSDITASECYAAEVLRGEELTGGLFGKVAGKMALSRSYSDCYLIANSGDVGGFAAACGNTSTIDSCYTAGYTIGIPEKSAGFVPAAVASVSNSYSVLNIGPNKMNQADDVDNNNNNMVGVTTIFYATVSEGTATNVYYALPEGVDYDANRFVGVGQQKTFSQLRSANAKKPEITNLKDAGCFSFSSITGDTTAYNLAAGLGLTNYPYPFLWKEDGSTVLHHYGDWDGNLFDAGTLVYFEQYSDGTRGYYGAGSDYLDSGKTIAYDGYALLYSKDSVENAPYYGTTDDARITYAGATYSVDVIDQAADKYTVIRRTITGNAGPRTYYFRDLPDTIVNSASAATGAFYTYIKVETDDTKQDENQGVSHYYFNPHFAATVEQMETATSPAPTLASAAKNIVRVRTPRHLYLLSTYFTNGTSGHFGALTSGVTVDQEMDLNYSTYMWTSAGFEKAISAQRPIADGTGNHSFDATYNGTSYIITGVSFLSDTLNSGMFGVVGNTGKVNNVVIAANATDGRVAGFNTAPQQRNNYAYVGVLAGNNQGIITNCAVAGYTINTDSYYSTLYAGGLVGFNNRTINNSSAETPIIAVRANACNAFIGALTGANGGNGFINSSYSISNLDVSRYISGTVRISGFAGTNAGTIKNAYTITAMTVSNVQDSNVDGFTPVGGSVQSCYFLTDGTYKFIEGIYAYGQTSQTARAAYGTSEMPGNGAISLDGFGKATAETTRYHNNTSVAEGNVYPYAAAVKDAGGFYVHYGDWISSDVLGNSGMLYWEHEVGGANEGYHFYALDENDIVVSTLCTSHDDGGVITEYGYGYFKLNSNQVNIGTPSFGKVNASELSSFVNTAACTAISQHFSNYYQFVLYNTTDAFTETVDGMYLTGANAYATANVGEKQYSFSPFFGATLLSGTAAPIEMQVRSIDQLQFLNWNQGYTKETYKYTAVSKNPTYEDIFKTTSGRGDTRTTQYYVLQDGAYIQVTIKRKDDKYRLLADGEELTDWKKGDKTPNVKLFKRETQNVSTPGNTKELVDKSNYSTFTYLGQASVTKTGQQTKSAAYNREVFNWKWVQTHDIKLSASVSTGFTPIAAAATSSSSDSYSAVLYAWFGSSFDGQSYKIEDVNISSDAFTVGLFGVTAGAEMKNVIMYSENDAIIQRNAGASSPAGAYSLGGLVGVVYDYAGSTNELTNCAIAGYRIIDNSKNQQTLGEANVGGLVGVCNGNLVKCSAVTSIEVNCTHRGTSGTGYTQATFGNYVRAGGLAGATMGSLTDCYTGGKISVGSGTLMESVDSNRKFVNSGDSKLVSFRGSGNTSTSIYVAGIGGSGFAQNYTNFSGESNNREGNPSFVRCYTYIELPRLEGTIRSISIIGSVADRYEQNNVKVTIKDCYYLDSIVNKAEMLSNVPKFFYNGNVTDVYKILNSTSSKYDYFVEMLKGSSVYLNKVFNDNNNGKYDTIQLTAKTMEELSALNIGSAWAKVDVVENGATINGKYSFPGSDEELKGRNYPFPAVITQKSDATGQTVHVHYGAWPKGKGLFSSKSTITLDLLTIGKDSEDVILTNYKDYRKTPIDISKLSFVFSEMDENGIVEEDLPASEIVNVTPELQSDGTVKLNILGRVEGNVTVTAVYDGVKEAEIQVTVVADYSIKATLVTVTVDENGNITQVQDVENPPALPTAYQQESLYWRLTAETANGVPLELFPSDWLVEPSTMDENYDTATIFQTDDGKILLKFSSLAAKIHNIQITAKNVTGVSGQVLTSSRSVELRFKVMQNPPTVTVYRYPQDAVNNELVFSGTYLYQLTKQLPDGTTEVKYTQDKAGEIDCSSIPYDTAEAVNRGYDSFLGYVLADSLHEVTDSDGNPVMNPDGSFKQDYVYFTDNTGSITYYNQIDNFQRNLTVYGQWTTATYNITYDTVYTDLVKVADGAQTTYTVAEGITLPRLASSSGDFRVTVDGREYEFAGWEISERTETGGWVKGSRYAAEEVTEKGNSGDITFRAVWNLVCTITYYPSGSDTPYTDAAFGTYASCSPTITLFTPPDADPAADQVFIGWMLKNTDLSSLAGWEPNVIYKNTIKNASSFTGDVELEAVWGVSYDIVYKVGTVETTDSYAVGYTYTIEEAAEAPDGYRFVNWKVSEIDPDANRGWIQGEVFSTGQVIDNTQAQYAGKVVLEPVYELAEYTITYDSAGGTTTPEPVTYKYTDEITIAAAVEKDECDFIGWKTNGVGSWGDQVLQAGQILYNQNGDVTLTAQWSERKYYVVYDVNGGQMPTGDNPGWTTSSDDRMVTAYTYSSGVYLVRPTRAGYTFNGWLQAVDIADNSSWPITPCQDGFYTERTGNVYMQAQWTPTPYTITYADSDGNVLSTQEYNITTALTIDNLPEEKGYTFAGWTVEVADSSDCNWTAATVSGGDTLSGLYGNVTLRCAKQAIPYTITYRNDDGSELGTQSYTVSDSVVLMSKPTHVNVEGDNKAYFFTGWKASQEDDLSGNWLSPNLYVADQLIDAGKYGDVTMTAQYHNLSLTLHASKGSNSEGKPYNEKYFVIQDANASTFAGYFGESLTPPERNGWTLDGWYTADRQKVLKADGSIEATVPGFTTDNTFNLTSDQHLYARWIKKTTVLTPTTDIRDKQVAMGTVINGNLVLLKAVAQSNGNYQLTTQEITEKSGDTYLADSFSTEDAVWSVKKSKNEYQFVIHKDQYLRAPVVSSSRQVELGADTSYSNWSVMPYLGQIYVGELPNNVYWLHITNSSVSLQSWPSNKIGFYTVTTRGADEYDT